MKDSIQMYIIHLYSKMHRPMDGYAGWSAGGGAPPRRRRSGATAGCLAAAAARASIGWPAATPSHNVLIPLFTPCFAVRKLYLSPFQLFFMRNSANFAAPDVLQRGSCSYRAQ